ncbi:MAG: hypothetical protein U1C70_04330 [Sediminibacterium sp.]|uniref:DUF6263 family protein n=1 Tax=Sediminibacterium sp. TaxID=1917865 RepID=UPI002ABC5BB7|nr:hypothetical protein [Sediminibacterium sp.]MDZ4071031.1 hypothetical protein [Sediminibacterium sp.]
MRKFLMATMMLGGIIAVKAQQVKLPVGKKFQVITEVKGNSVTSVMGQDMEMSNTTTIYLDHELKSVGTNKFSMGMIIKRITADVAMMGQEQSIDSDDEAVRSNPALAEAFKSLGKEIQITVDGGKITMQGEMLEALKTIPGAASEGNDIGRVFLLVKDEDIKEGYTWISNNSSETGTSETNNIIEKVTDKEIQVLANSAIKVSSTMTQNGMEIKQKTEGTVKSTRIYDRATGLMISEISIGDIKGNMEVMGQQMPLTSKTETKTSVKFL